LVCAGDCSGDLQVTIDELVLCVGLAMSEVRSCVSCDENGDGRVSIEELIGSVRNMLFGCDDRAEAAARHDIGA
jgi:hypothetical protein